MLPVYPLVRTVHGPLAHVALHRSLVAGNDDRFLLDFGNVKIAGFNPGRCVCDGDRWGHRMWDHGNRHTCSTDDPSTTHARADLDSTARSDAHFSADRGISPRRRSFYPLG